MSENNNSVEAGVDNQIEAITADTDNEEMVSISKVDFEKACQAAEDRVRSKLYKEIKDLKAQLPVPKTKAEIELESRLSEIEAKQLEIQMKEKDLAIRAALQEANLDKSFADFVKNDIDVGALCSVIDKTVNAKIAAQSYVPSNGHANNIGVSKEQLKSMKYTELEGLLEKNPNLIDFLK